MSNLQTSAFILMVLFALTGCGSPLVDAARDGDTAAVKELLAKGVDVNAKDPTGSTALIATAYRGDIATVKVLLDGGADVRMTDDFNWTPLMAAAEGGDIGTVEALIYNGAYISSLDLQSALGGMEDTIKPEIIKLLESSSIKHGKYRPERRADQGIPSVVKKISYKATNTTRQVSAADGVDAGATKAKWGALALIVAAMNGHADTVKALLDGGADLEVKEKKGGGTALIVAVKKGHGEIVEMLLEKGADSNAKDRDGSSALMYAAGKGRIDIVKSLLTKGADLKLREKRSGKTILMAAAEKGYTEIVQELLKYAAEVNATDKQGRSALMHAARRGHANTVMVQLDNGADVNARDKEGWTNLMRAANNGHTVTVKTLLDHNADINARQDGGGWTALMAAAKNGHIDVVKVLLYAGVDPDEKHESSHWTALMVAELNGHEDVVRLLEKAKTKPHKFIIAKTTGVKESEIVQKQSRLAPSFTPAKESRIGARWAVIIGISNYKDSRIPSLNYASDDAQAFYDWAVSPDGGKYAPARVKLLTDRDATTKNIKDALSVWLQQSIKEDMVTIFFSGHGSAESPDSPENLFLLSYDTRYDQIATTGFPVWYVKDVLKNSIKARRVVFIADASRSGGVGESFELARKGGSDPAINPISSGLQNLSKIGEGICIISASDDKQLSREGQEWGGGHGVFTYFLLKGLYGEADYNKDSRINLGELIPFLSENVKTETKNAQVPVVAGKFDPTLSIEKYNR